MAKHQSSIIFFILLLLSACSPDEGPVVIKDVWARPGLAGGNSAVYLTIDNTISQADTLLSSSSEVAESIEIHLTTMENGNMKMMPQLEVVIPPGRTMFEPGGLHVMLVGLRNDLSPGDVFELRLNFEFAGEITLETTVREP